MKPSELFCLKDKKFGCVIIFLRACNKKFQRANTTDIAQDGNNPPDDWLKTGSARDSQTRTRPVDSLICITCSLQNNAFSVLHYVVVALHYFMLHRFVDSLICITCSLENNAFSVLHYVMVALHYSMLFIQVLAFSRKPLRNKETVTQIEELKLRNT